MGSNRGRGQFSTIMVAHLYAGVFLIFWKTFFIKQTRFCNTCLGFIVPKGNFIIQSASYTIRKRNDFVVRKGATL